MLYEKSVGICICHRPTAWGFSHCPIHVGRQRRSPRLYMQSKHPAHISPEILCRKQNITYPRASTVAQSLTWIRNFARISSSQESARINAFFYVNYIPPHMTPDRGFCVAICSYKINDYFSFVQTIIIKFVS